MMNEYVAWLALALIGAFHGLNPGIGWLFAVASGLQEGSRSAVVRAFGPIAAGHAASIATVVAVSARARLVAASGAHQRRTVRAWVPPLGRPSSDKSSIGTSRAPWREYPASDMTRRSAIHRLTCGALPGTRPPHDEFA
jgi:hypothetical protein